MLRLASSALRTASSAATFRVTRVAGARFFSSHELSDADFEKKWKAYFEDKSINALEVRRGLNDVFAHDLVPSNAILEAAFRATRRVNDFPTSVRIFEGIKDKIQTDSGYKAILSQLQPVITELQLSTPEELGLA